MTKSELIAKLAARYPQLVAKDAELAVKMILDAMGKSLAQGQRIEIRGFGRFGLHYRPPRMFLMELAMRSLAWVLKFLLFALIVTFAVKNAEPVTVRYYFGGEWRAP